MWFSGGLDRVKWMIGLDSLRVFSNLKISVILEMSFTWKLILKNCTFYADISIAVMKYQDNTIRILYLRSLFFSFFFFLKKKKLNTCKQTASERLVTGNRTSFMLCFVSLLGCNHNHSGVKSVTSQVKP